MSLLSKEEQRIHDNAVAFAKTNKKPIARAVTDRRIYTPEDQPTSLFMAGSPGAGKTETSKALVEALGGDILRIDADELREMFEGYTGQNSYLFQYAASILVDKIHDLALSQQQSFILDATLSDYKRAQSNISRSLKKDRLVQILYVYQDPIRAWEFVQAREAVEGRKVLKDAFITQYFSARNVVNTLKKEFGKQIIVELLIKSAGEEKVRYKSNIDSIDSHLPEKYTLASLEESL